MSLVEVLGFGTGALCVWLAVRQVVWTFPVGIANNVAFFLLFVPAGLYADAALQVVYLVLAALGWRWWLVAGPDRTPLRPSRTPARARLWLVAGLVLATAAMWVVLERATDSTVPAWDAVTTALSLTAQLMLNRKWLENWYVWITADVLYVGLFVHKELYLTAVLYAGFGLLCVLGLRTWRAAMVDPAPEPVAA